MILARQLAWAALVCASYVTSQSTSMIRVDDFQVLNDGNRGGIQYGSGWTQWGFQDPVDACYRGTYTSTRTTGSYAMLSFRGTGISYYADKAPDSGIVLLAIDGEQYSFLNANSSTMQHQQAIFAVSGLEPGDHQIVIGTQPGYVNETGVVGLDFFGVTPPDGNTDYVPRGLGPGALSVPANAVIVDDEDISVNYSNESWKSYSVNSIGPNPLFYNRTQHTSRVPGSSLNFTFHGTGIWYFSDDFERNADVLISVDGSQGEVVHTSTGVTWISQRMSWSKTDLIDGEHVVTITHAGQSGQYANLDFFMYLPSPPKPEPASAKSIPVTLIVCSVAGGLAGLALVLLGVYFLYRQHRTAKKEVSGATKPIEAGAHHLTLGKISSRDSEVTWDEKKINSEVDLV